ncbi:nickel-binding protein [Nocardia pseudovaccinii]|uniref:nickel-binding protein n=1 Tax=Nocardia pseudovaccinii TaxID=189540 RepID=UPI0007A4EF6A|nr:nickel-binding protein [Nocardia pseudovaccinii]
MSLFLSIHQAPGISEEEVAAYGPEVAKGVHATFRQLFANGDSGYIVTLYEADSEAAVRDEFERVGFPVDTVTEIDIEFGADQLNQATA